MPLNKDLAHVMSEWNNDQSLVLLFKCEPFGTGRTMSLGDYATINIGLAMQSGDDNYVWPKTYGEYDVIPKFRIYAQCDDRSIVRTGEEASYRSYAWKCLFSDFHSVDLADAELIVRFLKAVSKKMDALTERFGHPCDFGQYVCRAMDALGITTGVFHYTEDPTFKPEKRMHHYPNGYRHWAFNSADFGGRINQAIEAWHNQIIAAQPGTDVG